MIAKKVIESDYTAIRLRQKSLIKHYERLKEIKLAEPKPVTQATPLNKNKPYSEIERKIEISRNNKALLSRIININNRKTDIIHKSATINNLKSLNMPYRKKEAKRIVNENEQIAKRLQQQKPFIHKKKFDKDFEQFKKYRVQLSKSRLLKYQDFNGNLPTTIGNKGRSMTPTLHSSQFNTERDQLSTPTIAKNMTRNQFALTVEDDSSYEADFN
jgi:Hemingway/CFA97